MAFGASGASARLWTLRRRYARSTEQEVSGAPPSRQLGKDVVGGPIAGVQRVPLERAEILELSMHVPDDPLVSCWK